MKRSSCNHAANHPLPNPAIVMHYECFFRQARLRHSGFVPPLALAVLSELTALFVLEPVYPCMPALLSLLQVFRPRPVSEASISEHQTLLSNSKTLGTLPTLLHHNHEFLQPKEWFAIRFHYPSSHTTLIYGTCLYSLFIFALSLPAEGRDPNSSMTLHSCCPGSVLRSALEQGGACCTLRPCACGRCPLRRTCWGLCSGSFPES